MIIDFDKDNKIFKLSVGKNPWRARGRVHIGKILSKYGGGGHDGAGGLEKKTKEEILKIADEVVEYLNAKG